MPNFHVDLSGFPPALHRILKTWYRWQGAYLSGQRRYPGYDQREPRIGESREQILWGGRPPEMTRINELGFVDDADVSEYLVWEDGRYFIDSEERGSRRRYWMFDSY